MNTMTDALKRAACAAIDAQAQRLTAFGRDILAHPELGYKETRTAGKVLEAFASLGLTDVTRPARTGVKGWLWRGGHRLQRRVLRRGAQLCRMHPGGP